MTIIEALKSGKPFKRKSWDKHLPPNPEGVFWYREDLMADDWEVKEERKGIDLIPISCDFRAAADYVFMNKINEIIEVVNELKSSKF